MPKLGNEIRQKLFDRFCAHNQDFIERLSEVEREDYISGTWDMADFVGERFEAAEEYERELEEAAAERAARAA